MRKKLTTINFRYYFFVLILQSFALGWLFLIAKQHTAVWGLGLIAYTLGLRHAFDADHIAAIDNTVRKLINQQQEAAGTGFYFSLGHSTVVFLLVVAVNFSLKLFKTDLPFLEKTGNLIGGTVSGIFLLLLAFANVVILSNLFQIARRKADHLLNDQKLNQLLAKRGFLVRILMPLLNLVKRSWQMYPIGFLFGLGFDTATEIALLAIAASSDQTLLGWNNLVFPVMFAAGMNLMDTTDSVMITSAYRWAFASPDRKIYYNLTVTLVSVVAAFSIGLIELLQVATSFIKQSRTKLNWLSNLNFNQLGIWLTLCLLAAWLLAYFKWQQQNKSTI
ncbi:MAG: HoxN/HupN/NixA family nickel/cobalt transporter [Liquorilactobacillus ghanensis]|uniref:HoxN/HupN/NixA family nickel/cobalt transporter n=1 Tax=Liquorilactobacillus ghanensis TaxID=399370 RepID=UPI0039E7C6EB